MRGRGLAHVRLVALGLTLAVVALPTAAAKVTHELRIGDAVSISSHVLRPGSLAGPYIEAGRQHRFKVGMRYWISATFACALPEGAEPKLVLRGLEAGEMRRVTPRNKWIAPTNDPYANRYFDFDLRFPAPGRWSMAIDSGTGRTYAFADGVVAPVRDSTRCARKVRDGSSRREAGSALPWTAAGLIATGALLVAAALAVALPRRRRASAGEDSHEPTLGGGSR